MPMYIISFWHQGCIWLHVRLVMWMSRFCFIVKLFCFLIFCILYNGKHHKMSWIWTLTWPSKVCMRNLDEFGPNICSHSLCIFNRTSEDSYLIGQAFSWLHKSWNIRQLIMTLLWRGLYVMVLILVVSVLLVGFLYVAPTAFQK